MQKLQNILIWDDVAGSTTSNW